MRQYHYIMQIVWLITSVAILIISTWMAWQDGIDRWWMMYLFIVLTLIQCIRHRVQYRKMTQFEQEKLKSPDSIV
jgi:heme/copper-type cytochrome/quinol oxidase subunit 4